MQKRSGTIVHPIITAHRVGVGLVIAEALAKAEQEVGIAVELAKFMSSLFPYAAWGRRRFVARGRRGP